jgi:hypothetical protein
MTDYHPVTREHCSHECVCLFFDHDSKIAKHDGTPCMRNHKGCVNCCQDTRYPARPDPLALLEAWLHAHPERGVTTFIHQLHTNPEAVREQGIKEGWYHD